MQNFESIRSHVQGKYKLTAVYAGAGNAAASTSKVRSVKVVG